MEKKIERDVTLDDWIQYIQVGLDHNTQRQSELSTRIIASATLLFGSIVALVGSIPYPSLKDWVMGGLAICGVVIGFYYLCLFLNGYQESSILIRLHDELYIRIITGELTTANNVQRTRENLLEAVGDRLKQSKKHLEYYDGVLFGESD